MLAIESKQVIEMKEGNTIALYTFRRVSNVYSYFKKGCRKKCTRQSQKVLWVVFSECLKRSSKSRFDSYSVRNSVLIVSHITFQDCRGYFFLTAFLEIAVYACKYELTGCIAGLNVVFPGLDLNIKSYDNNMQMKCGIQECKRGQCLDGIMAVL